MSPTFRRAVTTLGLGIAACSDGSLFGPADVSGSYGLVRYDGASPPRKYTTDHGCTVTVWNGSLALGAEGTFSLFVQRSRQCPGAAALEWVNLSLGGTFALVGSELKLSGGSGSGSGVTAHLTGTHVIVQMPQPAGLTPGTVTAEFAAGAGGNTVTSGTTETGGPSPPPYPPDSGTVVIIIKRR